MVLGNLGGHLWLVGREEASTRHLIKVNPFSVLIDLDHGTQM